VVAAVAVISSAAPADAGTLYVRTETRVPGDFGRQILYKADKGERNRVRLTVEESQPSPDRVVLTDPAGVVAGRGCSPRPGDPSTATCDVTAYWGFHGFEAVLGDRDDEVTVETGLLNVVRLRGGRGADRLWGSQSARNVLAGGDGDDILTGGYYDDVFAEGAHRNGSDLIFGGDGSSLDWVDYSDRHHGVIADSDGNRDDGERGERDKLVGVEAIVGGSGDDHLSGSAGDDHLVGGPGSDVLAGNGGDDRLLARWRPPSVSPGRGAPRGPKDRLAGGSGDDALYADGGGDTLRGGTGVDTIVGGGGADMIDAIDGATDEIFCRGGRDRLRQDPIDLHRGCERRRPQSRAAVPLSVFAELGKFGDKYVNLRVGCPDEGGDRCSGIVRWVTDGTVLGTTRFEQDLSSSGDSVTVSDELWQRLHDRDPHLLVVVATDGVRGHPVELPAVRLRAAPSLGFYYLPVEIPIDD
jgi:hypothetical protein